MKAFVFAAGEGTRLRPLTDTMPKALVPVCGKPLLGHVVEKLRDAGYTQLVVNVHHFPDMIIDYLREHDNFGCNIMISDERDLLLDTGGGLLKAWQTFAADCHEPILAMNVDILSTIRLEDVLAAYNPSDAGLLVVKSRQTQRYLCFDENDHLCGWTNIATGEVKGRDGRHLAFSGMQILSPEALRHLDTMPEGKFSLIDFYLHVMDKVPLQAYVPSDYRMMDVGKIDQIAEAEAFAESL